MYILYDLNSGPTLPNNICILTLFLIWIIVNKNDSDSELKYFEKAVRLMSTASQDEEQYTDPIQDTVNFYLNSLLMIE